MRLSPRLCWVLALAAFVVVGCNEVVEGTAPVTVTVTRWPGVTSPLEDVEVCETGTTNCALTNADGEATLGLPYDVKTSFTRTKEGFASELLPAVIPRTGTAFLLTLTNKEWLAAQHGNIDASYPMSGTGTVILGTFPRLVGATIELFGATGKTFYEDEDFNWTLDLTATTSAGLAGVAEINPGDEYRLEFGGRAEGCIPVWGWPSPVDNSVGFPVREGFIIELRVACP